MGTKERRERDCAAMRELILRTTARLLAVHGREGLTIRRIAAAIEYSPRTIYLYFRDKEHLLQELVEFGFSHTLAELPSPEAAIAIEPFELFRRIIRGHIAMAQSDPQLYRTIVYLSVERNRSCGPNECAVLEFARNSFQRCTGLPADAADRSEAAFFTFSAMLRGFALMLSGSPAPGETSDREQAVRLFVERAECFVQMVEAGVRSLNPAPNAQNH